MRRFQLFVIGCVALLVLALGSIFTFSRINDFELAPKSQQTMSFTHSGNALEGTLVCASVDGPVVLLVHGDGAQDRWATDTYLPLVNTLVDTGISVFSWDKPGVGASTGNWLHQSMSARADETVAALKALRQVQGFKRRTIGLLGFSQAGWVLPRVPALTNNVSFLVLVGGAVNWQAQGRYYATIRLEQEGRSPTEIAAELKRQTAKNHDWFSGSVTYEKYLSGERAKGHSERQILSRDRFHFAQLNYNEDARANIAKLTLPVLVLSGAKDMNANPFETVSVYRSLLENLHPRSQFRIVPNATHALLSANYYNYQLPDQWPLTRKIRFMLSGRDAYEGNVLENMTGWINGISKNMN